ncbi:MAG: hypothetical protein JST00_20815 [Deltaproteobacteria bacterium]|nr:hypothetical protein [Deltaproteobacteria bacterium]
MPLLNGTFGEPTTSGYGETDFSLPVMKKFLRLEIYSAVAYERSRDAFVGTRLGFAWLPTDDATARKELGEVTAEALDRSLARGAAFACSPTGSAAGCDCVVPGASLQSAWSRYGTW